MLFRSIPFKVAAGTLLLVASTGLAFAQDVDFKNEAPPCPCPPTLMDGFYVGAEVSYDVLLMHANFDLDEDIAVSGNPHLAARGWDGGLFLGFGKYLSDIFYLGGEVFGYWGGANADIHVTSPLGYLKVNAEEQGSYGLALLPGIKINQTTLAYLKGGYVWTNTHANATLHVNATPVAPGFTLNGHRNNNISGWEVGVGMETLLVDNWSLRADYTYVDYTNSNRHHDSDDNNNNNFVHDLSPRDNVFAVAVVYHIPV